MCFPACFFFLKNLKFSAVWISSVYSMYAPGSHSYSDAELTNSQTSLGVTICSTEFVPLFKSSPEQK